MQVEVVMSSLNNNELINYLYNRYGTEDALKALSPQGTVNALSLSEKQEILERLSVISKTLHTDSLSDVSQKTLKNLKARFSAEYSKTSNSLILKKITLVTQDILIKLNPSSTKVTSPNQQDEPVEIQYIKAKIENIESDQKQMQPASNQATQVSNVRRPVIDNSLDQNQVKLWIEAHPKNCQKAVETLVGAIRHIPHAQFEDNFINVTVKHLNRFVKEEEIEYWVAVQAEKSNQWMFELAKPHLLKQPNGLVPLAYASFLTKLANNPEVTAKDFPQTLVLFDDAMFSGEQMSGFLIRLNGEITRRNKELAPKGIQIDFPRIVIACAYVTRYCIAVLRKYGREFQIEDKLIILNHMKIPTVDEVIEDESIKEVLKHMYWPKISLTRHDSGLESRGVVYFDHKVSDGYSFPKAIAEGAVVDRNGADLGFSIEMIPSFTPPYKKNNKIEDKK